MEEISEVDKSLYFLCWYTPQSKNVINESIPDKRFDRVSFKESFLEICHVDNRERDSHFSSHSDAVSL